MSSTDQSPTRQILRLIAFARPYLGMVAVAIVASLLYGGGLSGRVYLIEPLLDEVALPHASLQAIDELLESDAADPARLAEERALLSERIEANFLAVLIGAVALVLAIPLVRMVRDYASHWVMTRLQVDLQGAVGEKLLRLPLGSHVREGRSDFVARLSNDTLVANRGQAVVFGDVVQDAGIVLTALAFAFYVSWQLALVLLLVGPPIALVLQIFGRRIRRSSQRRQEQFSDVMQRLVEILSGIKVIKVFHSEETERGRFRAAVLRYFRRSMKVVRNRVYSRSGVELLTQASFVSVVLVGIWSVLQGYFDLTIGKLMAFVVISAMLYRPARGFTAIYNTIHDALPAAGRVFEVLDAPEVAPDPPGAVELERVSRGIRFSDVSFSYGDAAVLNGVDLEIAAGEVVALVGRSGAGKTTLADLLLRFYEPSAGSIEIDEIDVSRIRRAALHALVAVVTQEAFLFDDTVAANIRYGRPGASDAEVVEAARAAHAHDFVCELPEGYATPVGDLGGRLSGGQRQRLAIARALLRDPQILVFDEATSALDAQAERLVQDAIRRLMRGRTVLLIAHRLSTLRAADRIAILESGRIVMTGTHDDLMARAGLYRELVKLQLVETPAA